MKKYSKLILLLILPLCLGSCITTPEEPLNRTNNNNAPSVVAAINPKNPKSAIDKISRTTTNEDGEVVLSSLDIQENSRASRLFISQRDRNLSRKYSAFAVVAFTSVAAPSDSIRYINICQAFMASLPSSGDEGMPEEIQQMVTAWPVSDQETAKLLNPSTDIQSSCNTAVNKYDLVQSLSYLDIARKSGFKPKTNGPFIIAWSPSQEIGNVNIKFLTMDLSNIKTYEQARNVFLIWQKKIQQDPRLWKNGWDEKSTLQTIGSWLDSSGTILPNRFWSVE